MAHVSYLDAIAEDFGTRDDRLRLAAVNFRRAKMIRADDVYRSASGKIFVVPDAERTNFYNLMLLFVIFGNTKLVRTCVDARGARLEIVDALGQALLAESEAVVDPVLARALIADLTTPGWRPGARRLPNPFRGLPLDDLGKSRGYYHAATARLARAALPPEAVDACARREVAKAAAFLPQLEKLGEAAAPLRERIRADRDAAQEFDDLLDLLRKN